MEVTEIKRPVKVVAIFNGGVRPVKFRCGDRVHTIKEITHTWRSRHGMAVIMHFSASDGENLYELSYNLMTMEWVLEAVSA